MLGNIKALIIIMCRRHESQTYQEIFVFAERTLVFKAIKLFSVSSSSMSQENLSKFIKKKKINQQQYNSLK